jgi:glycosyltransferase involved in cell wall biosynthesis
MRPKITVLITTYNTEAYLAEAIESILEQTFTDFELLLIDDGSTDNTEFIVRKFTDPRIVYIKRTHDYIASLNEGIRLARGKYIARMDADDRMHRNRLRIQYAIMEAEPSIDICGTWMQGFNQDRKEGVPFTQLSGKIDLPLKVLFESNAFYHPTTLLRKKFFIQHSIYYQNYPYAEDYKLWFEAAKAGAVFYIEPQILYDYRISDQQVSKSRFIEQDQTRLQILEEILHHLLLRSNNYDLLQTTYCQLIKLANKKIIEKDTIYAIFRTIFAREMYVYQ